jgi:2-polyprenyl-3-methyl-5-hydroxy-6-metoxy-1,4-benzoquinol methylase
MIDPDDIKEFYNLNQFPGHYTEAGLKYHADQIRNPYLLKIDQYLTPHSQILDVGCGTGLISNLFATRYPTCQITSIDFSNGINYATEYAETHNISNVTYIKQDFLKFNSDRLFDVVICQGVLHHIPMYLDAVEKLKLLVAPGGMLIVGVYHPGGKILKKIFNIDYKNTILEVDQESVPYETSFLCCQVTAMFKPFDIVDAYPQLGLVTAIKSVLNYRNGGLITYVFKNVI